MKSKKIKLSRVKVEFKKLSKEINSKFRKNKVSPKDVDKAIKIVRKYH